MKVLQLFMLEGPLFAVCLQIWTVHVASITYKEQKFVRKSFLSKYFFPQERLLYNRSTFS